MPRPSNYLPAFLFIAIVILACEQKSVQIVDPVSVPPVMLSATLTPATVNTDTISIGPIRDASDVLAIPVKFAGVVHGGAQGRVRYAMHFQGDAADLASGEVPVQDTAFSGATTVTFVRSSVGSLLLSLVAIGPQGEESTQFILPISVIRLNSPPVIDSLVAPDTVSPSHMTSFIITLRVKDPDGAADIRSVFRTGTTGNVFYLNDARLNGDAVAGDGIYTETVSLSPAPPVGSYTFTFRALDQLYFTSNVLSKTIVVVP